MPELPEVETVRRTLKNLILNHKIQDISIRYDRIIDGDPDQFVETLRGQTVRDIGRMGKYLIFFLDKNAFISHLRMEGKYLFVTPGQELNKHEHITFHLSEGMELRYHDTRKFGRMKLTEADACYLEEPLCKLGPEPWLAKADDIYQRIHKSSIPLKTLLLDQTILAGIGNIYANEICFRMRINPETPGNRISRKRTEEMLEAAKEILDAAIVQGGTTVHSFDANGISGLFQTELQVHMQKACPVCGTKITKKAVHGRGTYFCPVCQK